ncbi:hypothetical protein ACFSUK_06835 [Sphingobium scionense]
MESFLDDIAGLSIDRDEGIADWEQRGHDKRQRPFGDIDTEAACADGDDPHVVRADNALSEVACDLLRLRPERARRAQLRLADRRGGETTTFIHRDRSHNLIGTWVALVGCDRFDPDAPSLFYDAQIRLTAGALTLDDRQQRAARFEQRAAKVHFPEPAIDVAREALAEVRISIRLIGRPQRFDQLVKLLLVAGFRRPEVHEAAVEILSIDIKQARHRSFYRKPTTLRRATVGLPAGAATSPRWWIVNAGRAGSFTVSSSFPPIAST